MRRTLRHYIPGTPGHQSSANFFPSPSIYCSTNRNLLELDRTVVLDMYRVMLSKRGAFSLDDVYLSYLERHPKETLFNQIFV